MPPAKRRELARVVDMIQDGFAEATHAPGDTGTMGCRCEWLYRLSGRSSPFLQSA
jgi:hypothetical protein